VLRRCVSSRNIKNGCSIYIYIYIYIYDISSLKVKKLVERWKKCIAKHGDYIEK